MKKLGILLQSLVVICSIWTPQVAYGISSNDKHAVDYDTNFYDPDASESAIGCSANGGPALDGHVLPASRGGVGQEEPIDETGKLVRIRDGKRVDDVGRVAYAGNASLGQNYRDYYITMRWRTNLWNWDGTAVDGPEDRAFYAKAPRVLVTNTRTGKSIVTVVLEAGPGPWTGVDKAKNNDAKQGWSNPQDGTPTTYRGRVAGLPPKAIEALGAQMRMQDGSGDDLLYSWASDQSAEPGPTNVAASPTAIDSDNASTCSGGLGIDENGFVFPMITTQSAIKAGSSVNGTTLKWNYTAQDNQHHDYNAADIHAPIGTTNVVAVSGTVLRAVDTSCNGTYDVPRVQIKGDDGKYYYYTHMKPGSIKVTNGQKVTAGDPLGIIGPAECALGTAPHLHFQASTGPINSTEDPNEQKEYINVQPVLTSAFKKLPE